ncbi:MAG: protein phosphatase [Chloroflexi bacterium]|jgi:hypothetical protein|nr:protein phosphatase [Candidatus Parcubacteria bacterium]MBT7082142.1 protein phosphatase [Chloroflexota bacterium]
MSLLEIFQVAAGTVAGRDHTQVGKNNQDAFCFAAHDDVMAGVVCDGCSTGKHSEVGSKLIARLIVRQIITNKDKFQGGDDSISRLMQRIKNSALMYVQLLADGMGMSFSQAINDYFLFTLVGTIIFPDKSIIFSLGDGVFAHNGEVTTVGPFPGNAPPYLAYNLVTTDLATENPDLLDFNVHVIHETSLTSSILIGSDGICDLIDIAELNMPGKPKLVGPMSQFWTDDRYFNNPDMVRRKLVLINREATRLDREGPSLQKYPGLLPDDTTLIAIRRKPITEEGGED